ncbi:MAG: c-type cytochrome [Actinomycetota bacterium]|nr:c-type cytochrome [Actinomycetota bacterium]
MLRGLIVACALGVAALAASGCGGTVGISEAGSGDVRAGKQLFSERCGQCHVLADSGTQGQIGPNLDDAFVQSRADGLGETTIQSVVRAQIAYPIEDPPTGVPGMPKDLVTGEDAESVAAYVASVAGLPVQGQPASSADDAGTETSPETGAAGSGKGDEQPDGAAVFADAGCGSCHTFEAAGSTGSIGPNLDASKPPRDLVVERVTEGLGAMPSFADSLSEQEIGAVADYVAKSTGG